MRKWLVLSALAVAGLCASPGRGSAFYGLIVRPYYTPAAFPALNPPGYFTNVYYFPWYYPWYAYYNYSHGPYANWWHWGGYATYGGPEFNHPVSIPAAPAAVPSPAPATPTASENASVTVTLPEHARLLFNGTAAQGTGVVRTFYTPTLEPGREYAYELTAEVTRDGVTRKVTERVIVRAGQETKVTLAGGK